MKNQIRLRERTARRNGAGVSSSKKFLKPGAPIQVVLASGSKLFLEGVRRILERGGIKITAEVLSREEIAKRLTEVEAEFLFIDNRSFDLDAGELSDLINKKSSNTKVILLENRAKDKINLPCVIYVTKETNSSELIYIMKKAGAVLCRATKTNPHASNNRRSIYYHSRVKTLV